MKNFAQSSLNYTDIEKSLVQQMKDYTVNNGMKSCIVGVSGGIDSAVVSTLAAKTGLKTILLSMPIHQASDEITRADKHIEQLQNTYQNVDKLTINLTKTYEALKETLLASGLNEDDLYLGLVNGRSRLRMTALYGVANAKGGLVVGTGNKVEDYGIGFFTKYGDGGVDYSPIGELVKSEVYKLGESMGIITEILEAKPTDGLHPDGATDEDQIGATYDELERAMNIYDQGQRTDDFSGREKEIMTIYTKRHLANSHKMEMPPIANIPRN